MHERGLAGHSQSGSDYVYRFIDIGVISLCLFTSLHLRGFELSPVFLSINLLSVLSFLFFAEIFGLYRSWRTLPFLKLVTSSSLAWFFTCLALFALGFMLKISESFSRILIGSWMLSTLVFLGAWRFVLQRIYRQLWRSGFNTRTAAIVGLNDLGMRVYDEIQTNPNAGVKFDGFYDDREVERLAQSHCIDELRGGVETLIERTQRGDYDIIFITLPLQAQERINEILVRCGDTTATVHLVPDFFTYNLLYSRTVMIGNIETLSVYDSPIVGFNDFTKRMFDFSFSLIALLLVFPLMLVIAIVIKLTSKGPVIFKQERYGLDGKTIKVWKFRSMATEDNGDKVIQATKNDNRITPVGRFIRRTSLDELPQFINVLQGYMSVVGPRPHAKAHNEEYRKLISGYMLRHKVKPGITGWAQVNGFRGETETLDKMEKRINYDLEYIRRWSFWFDVKIIFLTIFKGFINKNAY